MIRSSVEFLRAHEEKWRHKKLDTKQVAYYYKTRII